MRIHVGLVLLWALVTFDVAAPVAFAADGRTPIPFATPVTMPIQINQPGGYLLTRDLSSTSGPVIVINATGVTIDLNGRTLSPAAGAIAAIDVLPAAEATIRNGSVVGGQRALRADAGSTAVVEDLDISGQSIDGVFTFSAAVVVVRRCKIVNTGRFGINVDGSGSQGALVGNELSGTNDGIRVKVARSVKITGNVLRDVLAGGPDNAAIYVFNSSSVVVEDNSVTNTAENGIHISGGSTGCVLNANRVSGAGGFGILFDASDGGLSENRVTSSTNDGIVIRGSRNHVRNNFSVANAGFGLLLDTGSTGNVLRQNTVRGNSGGPECELALDYCNLGPGNHSQGDNWMPGPT